MAQSTYVLASQLERISAAITELESRLNASEHRDGDIRTPLMWEPQPHYSAENHQSDYTLPQLQTVQPHPPTCCDTPWLPPHERPNSSQYNARQNDYDLPPWPDPHPPYNPMASDFQGSTPQYHRQPANSGSVPPPFYQPEWFPPPPQSYQPDRPELNDQSWSSQTGHQPWQAEYRATDRCVDELRSLPLHEPGLPYEQPPYSFAPAPTHGPESCYTMPRQQDRAWGYQLHRPSLPPLPIIKPTSCWGPPPQGDPFGPPQFDQHQPLSSPMNRPTCWDPPGQQGYPAYEQPPPFGWPTPPPTHMESLDRVFVEFRPQPPQLQRYLGETEDDRCYGDDFIHAHSPKLDESLDAYGCGYAHDLREPKEVDSSPSSLVVQIGYSCAGARDFDCFSERGMMNEMLCDKLERKLSTYSISETKSETNEAIDDDAAYSDIGNRSNPAIGLPSDFSGKERELLDDSLPPSAAISLHVTTPFLASNRHPQVDVPSSRKKEWEKNLLEDEEALCESVRRITEGEEKIIELSRILKTKEKENDFSIRREEEVNENFSELRQMEIKGEDQGSSLEAKVNDLSALPEEPNKNGKMEIQSLVGEHKVVFEIKEQELEVGRQEKRRLYADELRVRTRGLVMKERPIGNTMEILTKGETDLSPYAAAPYAVQPHVNPDITGSLQQPQHTREQLGMPFTEAAAHVEHPFASIAKLESRRDDTDRHVGGLHAQPRPPPAPPNGQLPYAPTFQPDSGLDPSVPSSHTGLFWSSCRVNKYNKEVVDAFGEWSCSKSITKKDDTNEKPNKTKIEFFFTVGVLALRQLCAILEVLHTFDPGGDTSPKLLVATLFVLSWFPP